MAELALQGVSKHFGAVMAVDGVDLEIAHGEFVVFVGPSGCGKSTMLRMISGLESVTAGRIRIGGRDVTHVPPSRRGVAMVFQSYALFPHMTAAQNIAFGLRLARTPNDEITRRVTEVAATLQIEALLERYPRELSGGQRQRVAIGRSIIRHPQVFLFDEPLSNLDAALRVRMRLEIARLRDRLDATMVYVTHDQTEAMTLADRIVVFNHGRIEQVGAPVHLYDAPANLFVAGFIGAPAMNFVPAVVESPEGSGKQVRFGSVSLPLPDVREAVPRPLPDVREAVPRPLPDVRESVPRPLPDNRESVLGPVTFGVRPEHLSVAPAGEGDFIGRVEIVEKLGAESLIYLQTEFSTDPVTIRVSPEQRVRAGDVVPVRVERGRFHLFGTTGTVV